MSLWQNPGAGLSARHVDPNLATLRRSNPPPRNPSMRILVIEDNQDIAANLGDFLEDRGHTVDFAADGITVLLRAGVKV